MPDGAVGAAPRLSPEAYVRMAQILRAGLVAALLVLGGATAYLLARGPGTAWSGAEANPSTSFLSLSGLVRGLAGGEPAAYLTLGVLLLLATPVVRVLTGLYYFQRDGERTIAGVALAVFVMLLVGLFVVGPLIR